MKKNKIPTVIPTKDGPFLVKDLADLRDSCGEKIPAKEVMMLCRCGGSKNKPFCDGTHSVNGFSGAKEDGRIQRRVKDYIGEEITVHDDRGICSHAEYCIKSLPNVFRIKKRPWIYPNAGDPVQIEAVSKLCPSGALSYTLKGVRVKDHTRLPRITVSEPGPYNVTGGIILNDPEGDKPTSLEHYTLCRCGKSKNKPFCDGSHFHVEPAEQR